MPDVFYQQSLNEVKLECLNCNYNKEQIVNISLQAVIHVFSKLLKFILLKTIQTQSAQSNHTPHSE